VAGLCARGSTRVRGMEYVKRGYEGIEEKLASLGARVKVFEGRMTS
jgi:UDP-N-acetylglucosamine enolpyruvyl transferase